MTAQPRPSKQAPSGRLARRRLLTLLALGAPGLLGACGKKGPLRLPEEPAARSAAPPASPPASSAPPASSDEETK